MTTDLPAHRASIPPPGPASAGLAARQIIILLVIGCLSLAGLATWHARETYHHQLEQTRATANNLSASLLTHAELAMIHASTILHGVIERLEHDGTTPASLQRLLKVARSQAESYAEIQDILIFDRHGDWVVSTRNPRPGTNYADRAYFQYHRANRSDDIHIGPPVRSRTDNDWVLTVSRRTEDRAGNFTGVVVVALSVQAFLDHYQTLELGPNSMIDLLHRDGPRLLRAPFVEAALQNDGRERPVALAIADGQQHGVMSAVSRIDGVRRLLGWQTSSTLPIYLVVGLDERQAFAQWRGETVTLSLLLAFMVAVIALLGRKTIASVAARQRAEADLRLAYDSLRETNQSLEVMVAQDSLTGLANRRQFDRSLAQLFTRAVRQQEPLSLLLIDVDNFKNYNDTFGHQQGDSCLRQVADCLGQALHRPGDLAARYGGEELAVLLPDTDPPGAATVAEAIRAAVYQAGLVNPDSPHGRVTVSIGIATGRPPADCAAPSVLLQDADAALYRAKRAGKNRAESSLTTSETCAEPA